MVSACVQPLDVRQPGHAMSMSARSSCESGLHWTMLHKSPHAQLTNRVPSAQVLRTRMQADAAAGRLQGSVSTLRMLLQEGGTR